MKKHQVSIREARVMKGYSAGEAAKMLEINPLKYAFFEAKPGLIDILTAKRMSKIFDVPLDDIFFGPNSTLSRLRERESE